MRIKEEIRNEKGELAVKIGTRDDKREQLRGVNGIWGVQVEEE